MVTVVALIAALAVLAPSEAFCYGPAYHLMLGSDVLTYLTLFSPMTQHILGCYPLDFLYGCIMPDIVIGKRFLPFHKHCHNWQVALAIRDSARTERTSSFALGYLCHLAADVVAHNYFVPGQMIATYKTRTLTHLYWETRLDNGVRRDIWKLAERFKEEDFHESEQLLEKMLDFHVVPFDVHNSIYKGYVLFSGLTQWHRTIRLMRTLTRHRISRHLADEVYDLSFTLCLRLLRGDDPADPIFTTDPMGARAMRYARGVKHTLQNINEARPFNRDEERKAVAGYQTELRRLFLPFLPERDVTHTARHHETERRS